LNPNVARAGVNIHRMTTAADLADDIVTTDLALHRYRISHVDTT
jgi:hypothetical protein